MFVRLTDDIQKRICDDVEKQWNYKFIVWSTFDLLLDCNAEHDLNLI